MTWHRSIERRLSLCLIAMLVLPVGALASTPTEVTPQSAAAQQYGQDPNRSVEQQGVGATPPAPDVLPAEPRQSTPPQQPTPPQQAPQAPAQNSAPLGTAAAPDTRIDGVAASTPSGAAIAPAKQKRVRKFSIRTAIVVGAVVAVGIVVGASAATANRP